ncbi:DNA topoisomerase IB [uncultured Jatrophihabitans sp.]|uniref:DNA topoisomerase IB n=1 Tax=uncultured Jatrophihabitans sp. TaxID=1610747 RepID=UPI0035CA03A0
MTTVDKPSAAALVAALYDDPAQCAQVAKLRYVSPGDPGLTRLRRGKGFTYRDATGNTVVDVELRDRLRKLAIPPAWRKVWIATWPDAHLLAVGEDDKGRRQYIYHERWRSIRDQLNFYRLIGFGEAMPKIRADVDVQLRRDVIDSDRVLAAMLRIMDKAGLRVGNEVYAEENDSYGLSTLTRSHVRVVGTTVEFNFPAKSGKQADTAIDDEGVARVIERLLAQRSRRLFTVDGQVIGSDEINHRLAELTGAHFTAKDFRTWKGSSIAFACLRKHLDGRAAPDAESPESAVLAAIDAAAELLNNTRTVCRSHYVHPDVVDGYTSGQLAEFLQGKRMRNSKWLSADERLLLAFLSETLDSRAGELAVA